MHNHTLNVQTIVTFSSKSLRNSKKMLLCTPKAEKPLNFQDSKYIINILKKENYVRN